MAMQRYDIETASVKFQEILEASRQGNDAIIEDDERPIAVMISYEDYLAIEELLDDLRAGRRAQAFLEEWKRDPSLARLYSDIRAEWIAEGLLDGQELSAEELGVFTALEDYRAGRVKRGSAEDLLRDLGLEED